MALEKPQQHLLEWYRQNQRPLPWRQNRDPYRVWISETMLQQTTTTAVIPFYERFLQRFPDLATLAQAREGDVVAAWAGLGYYSRARNLHKAAGQLHKKGGFPRTFTELLEYPGIGPYTARAVSSIAFGESVGVVDGNVIRVLSRIHGEKWEWWQSKVRPLLQARADAWVKGGPANEINQALMELGATICTPQSPTCWLCPLRSDCVARRENRVSELPLPKPRRAIEIWHWTASVVQKNGRILLVKNHSVPFFKGQWLLPGSARRLAQKPEKFDYRHGITHHDIFVTIRTSVPKIKPHESRWVPLKQIAEFVPASLVQKALRACDPAFSGGRHQLSQSRDQGSPAPRARARRTTSRRTRHAGRR